MELNYSKDSGRNVMVLIIEDERVSRKALTSLLVGQGYAAEAVESAEEGLRMLDRGPIPQVTLVDLDLPGMSGAEFIYRLSDENPGVRAVLITAADADRVAGVTLGRNIPHLRKPIDFNDLLALLDS
jgi:CheY-like chemotaxis protein